MFELMSYSISLDCFGHLFQIRETKMHKCELVTSMFSLLWSMHPYTLFWINALNIQKLSQPLNKSGWKYWHSAPLESWQFTHQLSFFEVCSRNQRKQNITFHTVLFKVMKHLRIHTHTHTHTHTHIYPYAALSLCWQLMWENYKNIHHLCEECTLVLGQGSQTEWAR